MQDTSDRACRLHAAPNLFFRRQVLMLFGLDEAIGAKGGLGDTCGVY